VLLPGLLARRRGLRGSSASTLRIRRRRQRHYRGQGITAIAAKATDMNLVLIVYTP